MNPDFFPKLFKICCLMNLQHMTLSHTYVMFQTSQYISTTWIWFIWFGVCLFWKGKCTKRPMSTFGCTFSAFFGFWVFFLWSPLGNYEKKSCVSSDLSARFKRPRKNKLMLRVSLKLLKKAHIQLQVIGMSRPSRSELRWFPVKEITIMYLGIATWPDSAWTHAPSV